MGGRLAAMYSDSGKGSATVLQQCMCGDLQRRRELRGFLPRQVVVTQGDVLKMGVVSVTLHVGNPVAGRSRCAAFAAWWVRRLSRLVLPQ